MLTGSGRLALSTLETVASASAPPLGRARRTPLRLRPVPRRHTQSGPNRWRITPPTLGDTWAAGNLAKIDHVVVVMMENRSYDHVLGYLAALAGPAPTDGMTAELRGFLQQGGAELADVRRNRQRLGLGT